MDPTFVARVNGLDIYRLSFGGYSVKCNERLIGSFETIEEAFRFCGMPNYGPSAHGERERDARGQLTDKGMIEFMP